MGWELIGGDPAPGSPDAVGAAAAALSKVADLASDARTNLIAQTGAAGIERWKGTAADAFRADVGKLPGMLDEVTTSYREAAGGLQSYRYTLEGAQSEARAILAAAQQAQSDHDTAQARMGSAQSELDGLESQHRSAEVHLVGLQTQQTLSIDPAHRASLTSPIASARSQVNRLQGDISSAQQTVGRYRQAMNEAQGRLDDARRRAQDLRNRISGAIDQAVAVLKQAERDAHLPNWFQEDLQRTEQWAETYGPEIIQVLNIAETVLSVAALVFPFAAPVLLAGALLCGSAILLTDVLADAGTPGGFDKAHLLGLGVDALNVLATAAGLGAVRSAMSGATTAAKTYAMVGTWAGRGGQALTVAEGYEENGVKGGLIAFGTVVVGSRVASKVGAKALQSQIAKANGNPQTRALIDDMSRTVRGGGARTKPMSVSLDDIPNTRDAQGVLGSGHIRPGGFLPGNKAASPTLRSLADHARSAKTTNAYAEKIVEPVSDAVSDELNTGVQDALSHSQPEIDINLHPSPYGTS